VHGCESTTTPTGSHSSRSFIHQDLRRAHLIDSCTGKGTMDIGISLDQGLITPRVVAVAIGSPAGQAGMQTGDLIWTINDTDVRGYTPDRARELIDESESVVRIRVWRKPPDRWAGVWPSVDFVIGRPSESVNRPRSITLTKRRGSSSRFRGAMRHPVLIGGLALLAGSALGNYAGAAGYVAPYFTKATSATPYVLPVTRAETPTLTPPSTSQPIVTSTPEVTPTSTPECTPTITPYPTRIEGPNPTVTEAPEPTRTESPATTPTESPTNTPTQLPRATRTAQPSQPATSP
jgi:hypothetical protein